MNRKQRTAAAEKCRKRLQDFYNSYLAHLPKVNRLDFTEPGVTHVIFLHDDWCDIYTNSHTCTCKPDIEYRVEPRRS